MRQRLLSLSLFSSKCALALRYLHSLPTRRSSDLVALIVGAELAAGFETNAVEDNTAGGETAERVRNDNSRYVVTLAHEEGATYGAVSPGTFVVRGSTAELGLGPDEDPFVKVRPVADVNDDGELTWQYAAIAARDIAEPITGSENVPDEVVKRIDRKSVV